MEFLDGIDLKQYVRQKGGKISESEAMYILSCLSDALMIVHSAEVLHRDISPDNIFICRDRNIKLIDFGAARQVLGEASKSLSVILKQGFAPLEQYQKHGKQGPWTDIYALGATIYYALTGQVVDDAMSRIEDASIDISGISPKLGKIIEKMLAVKISDRYQSVFELKNDLSDTDIESKYTLLPSNEPIKNYCEKCGQEIEPGFKICGKCEKKLSDPILNGFIKKIKSTVSESEKLRQEKRKEKENKRSKEDPQSEKRSADKKTEKPEKKKQTENASTENKKQENKTADKENIRFQSDKASENATVEIREASGKNKKAIVWTAAAAVLLAGTVLGIAISNKPAKTQRIELEAVTKELFVGDQFELSALFPEEVTLSEYEFIDEQGNMTETGKEIAEVGDMTVIGKSEGEAHISLTAKSNNDSRTEYGVVLNLKINQNVEQEVSVATEETQSASEPENQEVPAEEAENNTTKTGAKKTSKTNKAQESKNSTKSTSSSSSSESDKQASQKNTADTNQTEKTVSQGIKKNVTQNPTPTPTPEPTPTPTPTPEPTPTPTPTPEPTPTPTPTPEPTPKPKYEIVVPDNKNVVPEASDWGFAR